MNITAWCALTGGRVEDGYLHAPPGMLVREKDVGGDWTNRLALLMVSDFEDWGYPTGASAETCLRIWAMRHGAKVTGFAEVELPEGMHHWSSYDLVNSMSSCSWEELWDLVQHTKFLKGVKLP